MEHSKGDNGDSALRVLVLGADGFIGRAVCAALHASGHRPLRGVRRGQVKQHPDAQSVWIDFIADITPDIWAPRLHDVEAVINTVGIFVEHGAQTFQRIHVDAPHALFQACRNAGVGRVVQVSALGADALAGTAFLRSKREADEALHALLPNRGVVVRPSLVFGAAGASSRMLMTLALLPLTPLPDGGAAGVRPIHVDDLALALATLATQAGATPAIVDAVGPRALSLAAYLYALRGPLAGGRLRVLPVPGKALALLARVGGGRWLSADALAMLARGNTADATAITQVLSHAPRDPAQFLAPGRPADDLRVTLAWHTLAPVMRWSIALVWLGSGLTSLFGWPIARSLDMLATVGLHGPFAWIALVAGALLDLALGVATLAFRRRWLYALQIATIVAYTVILSVALPGFWLHPFAPLLKNLPMLAMLGVLLLATRER